MKVFDLNKLAHREGGEYVLGMKDLHSQACYLIYGLLAAKEGERLIRPGEGYEEILCAVGGPLLIHAPKGETTLEKGTAVHVKADDSFIISNPGDQEIIYIIAGGRCLL